MEKGKKGMVEKIVNMLLNIFIFIFGIILLISIYNNIQIKLFGKDYSDFFGYSIFEVQTGSMSPKVNVGDWIVVKSTNNIELDDVVTYKHDGEYITHRVIGKVGETYVTKGDANNSPDEPIDEKQIVGKVVKILANFGILKKTIFNPIVLIAIIITILICNAVFKNNKNEEKYTTTNNVENKLLTIKDNLLAMLKMHHEKKVEKVRARKRAKKAHKQDLLEREQQKKIEQQQAEELKKLEQERIEEIKKFNEIKEEIKEQQDEMNYDLDSYIPVDASELDDTFLEIAKNEIEEEEPKVEKKIVEQEENMVQSEENTKLNLELLERGKKCKNIIEKFISVRIEELNEIIAVLDDDGKTYVNEATIKNKLLSGYIDARYYNYYNMLDVSTHKKQSTKIELYLKSLSETMKNSYKGSDLKYSEKVDRFVKIFSVITNLEEAKSSITDKKAKEEFYKRELTKYSKVSGWTPVKVKESSSEIMKIQRNYVGILEYLFKKLETNMFNLEFSKLKTNKNMFVSNLEHNITFGKVYSDYIIDKTYSEGVIAENKIVILLNLLSIKIIRDMINSDFNKKYIVYLPKTLYGKEKKLEKTLSMIEDEHAKSSVIILIKLENLTKARGVIKKFKKDGYQFALSLTEDTTFDASDYTVMGLADYIFVDKNIPNIVKTLSTLPEDIADKLVYEDVAEKAGDFGGEE